MSEVRTTGLAWHELDERFPELERRELHDGVLVVMPAPAWWHQDAVGRVFRALAAWTDARGGRSFMAPVDVVTAGDRVYQPDVWLLHAHHLDRLDPDGKVHAPVDLVVKVSSPSTRSVDLLLKLNAYAAFGIPEYWFLDLDARMMLVHQLGASGYGAPEIMGRDGTLTSEQLPGFVSQVASLLPTASPSPALTRQPVCAR